MAMLLKILVQLLLFYYLYDLYTLIQNNENQFIKASSGRQPMYSLSEAWWSSLRRAQDQKLSKELLGGVDIWRWGLPEHNRQESFFRRFSILHDRTSVYEAWSPASSLNVLSPFLQKQNKSTPSFLYSLAQNVARFAPQRFFHHHANATDDFNTTVLQHQQEPTKIIPWLIRGYHAMMHRTDAAMRNWLSSCHYVVNHSNRAKKDNDYYPTIHGYFIYQSNFFKFWPPLLLTYYALITVALSLGIIQPERKSILYAAGVYLGFLVLLFAAPSPHVVEEGQINQNISEQTESNHHFSTLLSCKTPAPSYADNDSAGSVMSNLWNFSSCWISHLTQKWATKNNIIGFGKSSTRNHLDKTQARFGSLPRSCFVKFGADSTDSPTLFPVRFNKRKPAQPVFAPRNRRFFATASGARGGRNRAHSSSRRLGVERSRPTLDAATLSEVVHFIEHLAWVVRTLHPDSALAISELNQPWLLHFKQQEVDWVRNCTLMTKNNTAKCSPNDKSNNNNRYHQPRQGPILAAADLSSTLPFYFSNLCLTLSSKQIQLLDSYYHNQIRDTDSLSVLFHPDHFHASLEQRTKRLWLKMFRMLNSTSKSLSHRRLFPFPGTAALSDQNVWCGKSSSSKIPAVNAWATEGCAIWFLERLLRSDHFLLQHVLFQQLLTCRDVYPRFGEITNSKSHEERLRASSNGALLSFAYIPTRQMHDYYDGNFQLFFLHAKWAAVALIALHQSYWSHWLTLGMNAIRLRALRMLVSLRTVYYRLITFLPLVFDNVLWPLLQLFGWCTWFSLRLLHFYAQPHCQWLFLWFRSTSPTFLVQWCRFLRRLRVSVSDISVIPSVRNVRTGLGDKTLVQNNPLRFSLTSLISICWKKAVAFVHYKPYRCTCCIIQHVLPVVQDCGFPPEIQSLIFEYLIPASFASQKTIKAQSDPMLSSPKNEPFHDSSVLSSPTDNVTDILLLLPESKRHPECKNVNMSCLLVQESKWTTQISNTIVSADFHTLGRVATTKQLNNPPLPLPLPLPRLRRRFFPGLNKRVHPGEVIESQFINEVIAVTEMLMFCVLLGFIVYMVNFQDLIQKPTYSDWDPVFSHFKSNLSYINNNIFNLSSHSYTLQTNYRTTHHPSGPFFEILLQTQHVPAALIESLIAPLPLSFPLVLQHTGQINNTSSTCSNLSLPIVGEQPKPAPCSNCNPGVERFRSPVLLDNYVDSPSTDAEIRQNCRSLPEKAAFRWYCQFPVYSLGKESLTWPIFVWTCVLLVFIICCDFYLQNLGYLVLALFLLFPLVLFGSQVNNFKTLKSRHSNCETSFSGFLLHSFELQERILEWPGMFFCHDDFHFTLFRMLKNSNLSVADLMHPVLTVKGFSNTSEMYVWTVEIYLYLFGILALTLPLLFLFLHGLLEKWWCQKLSTKAQISYKPLPCVDCCNYGFEDFEEVDSSFLAAFHSRDVLAKPNLQTKEEKVTTFGLGVTIPHRVRNRSRGRDHAHLYKTMCRHHYIQ